MIENMLQVAIGIGLTYIISSMYEKHRLDPLLIAPLYGDNDNNVEVVKSYENDFDAYVTGAQTEKFEPTETPPIPEFDEFIDYNQTQRIPQVLPRQLTIDSVLFSK